MRSLRVAAFCPLFYAGLAPGFAGLYQVNIQIPPLAPGRYDLRVFVQGSGSNAASISVQ